MTDVHFEYDTFDKMKVGLAVQILSESVARGLEHCVNKGFIKSSTDLRSIHPTINFTRNLNVIFDLLNAKSMDDVNQNKRGINKDNIDQLSVLHDYISSLKILEGSTVYWIQGLRQTIKGVIGMFGQIQTLDNDCVLMTRNINQDPLENLFGQVRAKGGNNRNPYLLDFLRIISRIMTTTLLLSSKKTNCELDATTQIQILDFDKYKLENESRDESKPV